MNRITMWINWKICFLNKIIWGRQLWFVVNIWEFKMATEWIHYTLKNTLTHVSCFSQNLSSKNFCSFDWLWNVTSFRGTAPFDWLHHKNIENICNFLSSWRFFLLLTYSTVLYNSTKLPKKTFLKSTYYTLLSLVGLVTHIRMEWISTKTKISQGMKSFFRIMLTPKSVVS